MKSQKKLKVLKFKEHQQIENPQITLKLLEELIKAPPLSAKALEKAKYKFAAENKVETLLNRDLIVIAQKNKIELPPSLQKILQKRSVRTISGVSPIGILTKPFPCPGKCVYCPTEVRMPKSYLSSQPAAARAVRNNFHPYLQVKNRITALKESGHPVSKLEIIVMGGTWSFLPHKYQSWYIKKCFDAANGVPSKSLTEAQKINETADHKIVGLTLETRPDFITEKELIRMREMGCTRIEVGVQTLDDEIQKLTNRGHYKKHVVQAMKLMKDFGFKVCFHLMPGLPGSTPAKDLKWLKEVFTHPDFQPDFVKLYPCVVLDNSELKQWWKDGKYTPLNDEELIKLILKFKAFVPPWTRIMRLMRDIPANNILGGAKLSNLRQIIKDQPKKLEEIVGTDFYEKENLGTRDWPCRCIRCREIGFKTFQNESGIPTPVLKRRDFEASGTQETFLSFESEDEKYIFALLRLRKGQTQKFAKFNSILSNAALIREVHSYGTEISVGAGAGLGQHRGLGKELIAEAERIAKEEWNQNRITIIAGIGTREYYKKWGYTEKCTYMTKKLK